MSNEEPIVSIVLPARNRAIEAMRAIECVRNQSETRWELIVVDDASSVPLFDEIEALDDSRIVYVANDERRGAAASRNRGVQLARARIVAFLDSDDIWLRTKLEADLTFLESCTADTDKWFAIGQIWTWSDGQLVEGVSPSQLYVERLDEEMFVRRRAVQTSSLLVPRRLLIEYPFDESLMRLQDWDLVLRLWLSGAECVILPGRNTIYVASTGIERISNTIDPEFLERWVVERREWISDRAYRGYLANKLAPELVDSGRRLAALHLVVAGAIHQAMTRRFFALEATRTLLPSRAFYRFISTYRAVAGTQKGRDTVSVESKQTRTSRLKGLISRPFLATQLGRAFFIHRSFLGPIGWDRSARERMSLLAEGDAIPWITYPALRFLSSRLPQRRLRVFEWGAGTSTTWWATMGNEVVSCEHDLAWYLKVVHSVPGDTRILLHDVDSLAYVDCVHGFEPFDVIVIDGRRRNECALAALDSLSASGVILWDNTDRERYFSVIGELESAGFRRVDFVGLAPGTYEESMTSIFYRDQNFLGL